MDCSKCGLDFSRAYNRKQHELRCDKFSDDDFKDMISHICGGFGKVLLREDNQNRHGEHCIDRYNVFGKEHVKGIATKSMGIFIGTLAQERIVNGEVVLPGEYPYAVSYRYYDSHNCGASIIGRKWILTAAHCIHIEFNDVASILFGTINIENGNNPTEHVTRIEKAVRHSLYEPYDGYRNDIGLLQTTKSLIYNKYVQPIKLPKVNYATPVGSKATLVGWGYPMDNSQVLDKLHKVDIHVYSDENCKRTHGANITTEVHICAGVPEGGKGQCSGDSGGPLTVDGIQIGIVSWSKKPCTVKGYPGVFTRVSHFRTWITTISSV
ncbi:hypothetical protein FQA39_LY05804 [Lamprigera yunnana]|nr:hypothetical protein FQA39_LY05804 [Lamprigera yunnana]